MARLCKIEKEKKRRELVLKYQKKRDALRVVIRSQSATLDEKSKAQKKIQELPRDSNRVRRRSRCIVTGRSRGIWSKFMLCKSAFRELAMQGFIPGITKSSW